MVALPLIAALISLACAAIAGRRYWQRHRPHELAWCVAFGLFALAAAAQVVGDLAGWSPFLVRLYYVAGATLNVGFLGLGSLYLLLRQRLDRWGPGIMLVLVALGVAFVFNTPVDTSRLADGWHALATAGTPTRWLTIIINAVGSLVVIGGALYSAFAGWRRGMPRDRALGLVLIAGGTLLVASGGTLVGIYGKDDYLYLPMAPGIAIILAGYLLANRAGRPATRQPVPAATPAGDAAAVPLDAPEPVALAGAPALTRNGHDGAAAPAEPAREAEPARAAAASAATLAPPIAPATPVAARPLGAADAAAVRALLDCAGAASALAADIRYRNDEAVAALLARADCTWLGATLDGRIVGVASLVPGGEAATRHTAHLAAFAVAPDATGCGAGTALATEALRWAREALGLARLDVWVYVDDDATTRFFERRGFAREGVARRALFTAGRHRDVLVLAWTSGE
ncbi:MAG TPA: GNAT family N-acetyltransferase [Thermomicrobiales bacterium]|nr:GNAT family N-acetyltransferase [Thermomicrobiales bacterium]